MSSLVYDRFQPRDCMRPDPRVIRQERGILGNTGSVPTMAVALVILLWMSFGVLFVTLLMGQIQPLGYVISDWFGASWIATHFTLGVCGSIFALFVVVITMFYFIGTAKAVKEGVRDYQLDRDYYELTLKYKRKFFPAMTVSLLFYIALPSLGAASMVNYVDPWIHGVSSYLTLMLHGWICFRGQEYLLENDQLVAKVDYLIQKRERADQEKPATTS